MLMIRDLEQWYVDIQGEEFTGWVIDTPESIKKAHLIIYLQKWSYTLDLNYNIWKTNKRDNICKAAIPKSPRAF